MLSFYLFWNQNLLLTLLPFSHKKKKSYQLANIWTSPFHSLGRSYEYRLHCNKVAIILLFSLLLFIITLSILQNLHQSHQCTRSTFVLRNLQQSHQCTRSTSFLESLLFLVTFATCLFNHLQQTCYYRHQCTCLTLTPESRLANAFFATPNRYNTI